MKIAVQQARTGIDPAANATILVAAIQEAAAGGAAMLFTPEMSGLLDGDRERGRTHIRSEAEDPVLARVCEAARDAGVCVHLGSLALIAPEDEGRFVNRGFVIDGQGRIRARYDKMHLFDVDLATGDRWRE